jgi:two-component system, NarL family, nitrate/nitrite response regulator NarL
MEAVMPGSGSPQGPISILIAGYTRIYAELLAEVLKRDRSMQIVGVASSSKEALELAAKGSIDIAAVSLNLDEQPERGCDVARELRALHPNVRVIMLLDSAKKEKVVNAFRAGAKGVFSKNSPLARFSKCVRCVHGGQVWINHEELAFVLENLTSSPIICAVDAKGISLLTEREKAVVECVAEGLANHEIAERLHLSRHTVKNYLFRIFDKLGVSNRVELIFLAFSRQSDPPQTRIGPKPVYEFPLPSDPNDLVAAYAQCPRAEHDVIQQGAQVQARKKKLVASLTSEQIARASKRPGF